MKRKFILLFFGIAVSVNSFCQITEAEYFFDVDPGVGNGTTLSVVNGNTIDEVFSISTAGLSEGIHFLNIRVKGTDDVWSLYYFDSFYVYNATFPDEFFPITDAEYFIDDDPGAGNGESLSITAGFDIDEDFSIPVPNDLADGLHTFHIRVKTAIGDWTPYIFDTFTVDSSLSIAEFNDNHYILYPNPVNDFLSISFKNESNYKLQILDINGRELLNQRVDNRLEDKLDFSKFNNGIYLLKIIDLKVNQSQAIKIIKS